MGHDGKRAQKRYGDAQADPDRQRETQKQGQHQKDQHSAVDGTVGKRL